jgi:hypothetical protein
LRAVVPVPPLDAPALVVAPLTPAAPVPPRPPCCAIAAAARPPPLELLMIRLSSLLVPAPVTMLSVPSGSVSF